MAVSDLINAVLRAWRRLRLAKVTAHARPTEQDQADALRQMTAPLDPVKESKTDRTSPSKDGELP